MHGNLKPSKPPIKQKNKFTISQKIENESLEQQIIQRAAKKSI